MFGPFSDPRVGVEVGKAMGKASENIREKRVRASQREELGNRSRTEPSDTDELIDDLESSTKDQIKEIGGAIHEMSTNIEIEFYPTNIPLREETQFGPDIGLRLHLHAPGFNVTKGVLLQCKRLYGNDNRASYDQLRGDGEEQAARMLRVTPASFFLLFNGVRAETVLNWMKPPALIEQFSQAYSPSIPYRLLRFYGRAVDRSYGILNPGITVLPASRVYAESRVARRNHKNIPIDAQHWASASIPFGVFIADLYASCFIGDVRKSVLNLVTPPVLRDLDTEGVEDSESSYLPIRRLMNLSVTTTQL